MSSTDLYVIAAGNGSRMRAPLPKALAAVHDEPCLTTTLRLIGMKFTKIFVVTNVLATGAWQSYFEHLQTMHPGLADQVLNLPIRSGLGDGHATLRGLEAAQQASGPALAEDIVVAWGDVFFPHPQIIDELLGVPLTGAGLFPVVRESDPYVALLVDDELRGASVDFSKFGERHSNGFHDQSVFRFDRSRLQASLRDLHNCCWKNGRYITPGGELSLLYAVHHLYNLGDPIRIYETRYPTLSFNTIEEVVAIRQELAEPAPVL